MRRREAARRAGAVPSLKKALPKDPALPVALPAPPNDPGAGGGGAGHRGHRARCWPSRCCPVCRSTPTCRPRAPGGEAPGRQGAGRARAAADAGQQVEPILPPKPHKLGKKELAAIKAAGGEVAKAPVAEGAFTLGTSRRPARPGRRHAAGLEGRHHGRAGAGCATPWRPMRQRCSPGYASRCTAARSPTTSRASATPSSCRSCAA